MRNNLLDLLIRFILGGTAVALCYILLMVIPYKSFAGIFAAFPAVMVSAVVIAGVERGNKSASDIAFGAVAGMAGGLICVIATLYSLHRWQDVSLAIVIGLVFWFISSVFTFYFIKKLKPPKHYLVGR